MLHAMRSRGSARTKWPISNAGLQSSVPDVRTARRRDAPGWLDTLLFIALMSGPPALRDRDMTAALAGEIDTIVLIRLVVWACGALWVAARLYPSLRRRGVVPAMNNAQVIGALLIAALSVSLWHSPGFLLTLFTLGQFTVMLTFAWLFADRFGPRTYLRHIFIGVCVLTLCLIAAALLNPGLVIDEDTLWFRGDRVAPTAAVAGMGLIFCLSSIPRLRSLFFWIVLVVLGAMLATSRVRTAYVAMLVYLAIGYLFGAGLRVRRLVPLLVILTVGVILLDAFSPATTYIVRDTESLGDMSDRVPLWGYLTTAVLRDEPLFGFGYYAASRVFAPQYNPSLGNAHSAFFEVLVGGGLIGAGLYLALCASLMIKAGRLLVTAGGQAETVATVGLFAFTLVLGLTSTESFHAGPVGFTFWSMTAILPAMSRAAGSRVAYERQRLRMQRRATSTVQTVTPRRSLSS